MHLPSARLPFWWHSLIVSIEAPTILKREGVQQNDSLASTWLLCMHVHAPARRRRAQLRHLGACLPGSSTCPESSAYIAHQDHGYYQGTYINSSSGRPHSIHLSLPGRHLHGQHSAATFGARKRGCQPVIGPTGPRGKAGRGAGGGGDTIRKRHSLLHPPACMRDLCRARTCQWGLGQRCWSRSQSRP